MIKWLLVVAVVSAIYVFFIKKKPITQNNNSNENKKDTQVSDEMVECQKCGIYVALDETILSNNKYYCSQECLEKA